MWNECLYFWWNNDDGSIFKLLEMDWWWYTDLKIHITLELADLNNDKENFYKILNRKNKKYKKLFEKHIILTEFDYDFENSSFI